MLVVLSNVLPKNKKRKINMVKKFIFVLLLCFNTSMPLSKSRIAGYAVGIGLCVLTPTQGKTGGKIACLGAYALIAGVMTYHKTYA